MYPADIGILVPFVGFFQQPTTKATQIASTITTIKIQPKIIAIGILDWNRME